MRIVLKVMLFCEGGDINNDDKAAKGKRMMVSVRMMKMRMILWFVMMNGMKRLMVIMKVITRNACTLMYLTVASRAHCIGI